MTTTHLTDADRVLSREARIGNLQVLVRELVDALPLAVRRDLAEHLSRRPDGIEVVAELLLAVDPDRVLL